MTLATSYIDAMLAIAGVPCRAVIGGAVTDFYGVFNQGDKVVQDSFGQSYVQDGNILTVNTVVGIRINPKQEITIDGVKFQVTEEIVQPQGDTVQIKVVPVRVS